MGLFSLSTMCDHAYRLFFVLLLEKILSDKTCLHHFYLKLYTFSFLWLGGTQNLISLQYVCRLLKKTDDRLTSYLECHRC